MNRDEPIAPATPEKISDVVKNCIALIRSLTELYGSEHGMKVWDTISKSVSEEVRGELAFGILTGKYSNSTVTLTQVPSDHIVNTIKAIREVTGLGLYESKKIVDRVCAKESVRIECSSADDANRLLKDLRSYGCLTE